MTQVSQEFNQALERVNVTARELAKARVDEAETFLRFRISAKTDTQARAQAIVETNSRLDIALAEFEIAKAELLVAAARIAGEK